MTRSTLAFPWTCCVLLALACSTKSEPPTPEPQVGSVTTLRQEGAGSLQKASSLRVSATVESVDAATRKATLRLPTARSSRSRRLRRCGTWPR